MVMALKLGQMEQSTLEDTTRGGKMEEEPLYGLTDLNSMETLKTTNSKAEESTSGQMEGYTTESGTKGRCMERENILGGTGGVLKVNTIWTKRKDLGFTLGQTEESTREIGLMESSMALARTLIQEERLRKESGLVGSELDGYKLLTLTNEIS